jgi:flagellar motor switch protein FliG
MQGGKKMRTSATKDSRPVALRKAAILIATLDTHTADRLLERMPDDQAALVRQAVMDLHELEPREQEAVIREFMDREEVPAVQAMDGVELTAELAEKLRAPGGYTPPLQEVRDPAAPFRTISAASDDVLVRHLERQHPQAIALVVAHFPPARAAAVVKRLRPALQADVLRRVAELHPTDPEILREVELALQGMLDGDTESARHRAAGLTTVAAIVRAAGPSRGALLGNLEQHSRALAGQLEEITPRAPASAEPLAPPPMDDSPPDEPAAPGVGESPTPAASDVPAPLPELNFEELSHLGDDDWAVLIRCVDTHVVFLALAGASEQLVDRIAGRLPRRESREFRRRLERLGPVQLADLRLAQRQLVERAGQLAAEGAIHLPVRRQFAAAA